MNEKQRQLVLLIFLMIMLSVVLVFLLTYAPESPLNNGPSFSNNITSENPASGKNVTRSFEMPGIFGESYEGLKAMWGDIQNFGEMSG